MFWNIFSKSATPTVESTAIAEAPVTEKEAERPTIERNDFVDDDAIDAWTGPSKESEFVIKTGLPIDKIYAYVAQDFEREGYDDACINQGKEFCETKVSQIRVQLKNLFRMVRTDYKGRIRKLNVDIHNAEDAFAISASMTLQALKETCEEHLTDLDQMEKELDANDPRMICMIETYRRGFIKGINARTLDLV